MSTDLHIFTVGHSSHPLGTFIWLLRKNEIEAVVDIRRYPGSKRHPQFGRDNLAMLLPDEGIEYQWLEALGGRRQRKKTDPPSSNPGLRDQSFRTYADYMASDGFQQGVAKLLVIAGNRPTAVMCAEGDYRHCHRRLLSDYLVATGVTVQHILPRGEVQPHTMTAGAKIVDGMVTYPGQPTLFDMGGSSAGAVLSAAALL